MGLFDPLVSRPPSTKLSARDSSLSEEEIAKIDRASCFDIVTRCTNSALFSHHFDNAVRNIASIPLVFVFKFVQYIWITQCRSGVKRI